MGTRNEQCVKKPRIEMNLEQSEAFFAGRSPLLVRLKPDQRAGDAEGGRTSHDAVGIRDVFEIIRVRDERLQQGENCSLSRSRYRI